MTYNDYLIKITETMKIRSTNFRLSQNDIIIMVNNVYDEIGLEVNLDFIQQQVLIDKDTDEYDIDDLYTQVANELPTDVMSIQDENGYDLTKYFNPLGRNTFKVNRYLNEEKNYRFLTEYDGKYMTFNRAVVPDIETLSVRLQTTLLKAIVQGLMYYTEDAIPNPVGDTSAMSESNIQYQRYFKAIESLKKILPQRI